MSTGTQILPSRYCDAELAGRGAMADVYRATDSTLGRVVAVKLLSEALLDDDSVRLRFRREARAAARLSDDPNIVTIYDVGEFEGRPFIVMEYLSGGTLDQRLRDEGAQPPGRVLGWLDQAGRALDRAHALGIVHRDVKPGNLLFDEQDSIHVADFGIASAAGSASLTVTGTVLGTAGYLSPEQASGERASPASDRYALGVVAFELLTGERPFARESATAEAVAHTRDPVPPVCMPGRHSPAVDDVFRRALAKRPEDRYATCAELASALRAAFAEQEQTTRVLAPVAPPPRRASPRATSAPARSRKTGPRKIGPGTTGPKWPLVAAILGAAAVAGVALAVAFTGSPDSERASAPTTARQSTPTHTTPTTTTPTTTPTSAPTTTQAAPPPPPPPPPAATGGPHSLNDQAWALMKQGRYEEALPLLEQAVPALKGTGPGDLYEGYANYNLGYTLLQLGRCKESKHYLDRAKHLEPDRTEVDTALDAARACGHPRGR